MDGEHFLEFTFLEQKELINEGKKTKNQEIVSQIVMIENVIDVPKRFKIIEFVDW